MVLAKGKKDISKRSSQDVSPKKISGRDISPKQRNPKEASSSKVYRKSPSRAEASKSPSRLKKSPQVSPVRAPKSKSPSRKSPVRKSPARKSPSRKSPARKSAERSPAKKSPGRKPISEASLVASAKASPGRSRKTVSNVIEVESDSDTADVVRKTEKPKAAVRGRARKLDEERISPKVLLRNLKDSVENELEGYIGVVRRSVQKSHPPEVERIVHLQHEPAIKKLSEFSDEDDIPISRGTSKGIEDTLKVDLSGTIGALLAIFCTPLVVLLYISCNETHCSFTKLPSFQRYKYLSTFFDRNAFLVFAGFSTLVAILSAIPLFGAKVSGMPNKQGKLNYTTNGLFIATVSILTVFILEFFNVSVISVILPKYLQLIISALILGCSLSLYLYIISFFVPVSALNPLAITNSRLHNFNIGRELNPRMFKKLDVKFFLLRILMISMVLLNAIFIYKGLEFIKASDELGGFDIKSLKINPTLLVIGVLQIIYAIDFLIFERTAVTSYSIQYEGVGYFFCVAAFIGAFSTASITKYIYDYRVALPAWQLVASILLYCCGYFLYRASNLQKHAFRINPYSPSVSHLESLPTPQGKKLLVSGFWGFVRHPNYLGDILIQLSFALFVLTKPPVIASVVDILYLLYRAQQDGARCKQAYGAVWDRYCHRVKYVLIPKVY